MRRGRELLKAQLFPVEDTVVAPERGGRATRTPWPKLSKMAKMLRRRYVYRRMRVCAGQVYRVVAAELRIIRRVRVRPILILLIL